MFLENVVHDAVEPGDLGRFWEALLGTATLTDEEAGYETRFEVPDGPVLDLGFQRVLEPPSGPCRLRFGVHGGADPGAVVERAIELGATRAGTRGGPGVALADPAGNPFFVVDDPHHGHTGAVAALALDVADPASELGFWAWLTGWVPAGERTLRHPSQRGPVLELRPEMEPKTGGKNRIHLDVRLEPGDDHAALAREIGERGGRRLEPDWGELPWRTYQDPSGNEFCLLPARPAD